MKYDFESKISRWHTGAAKWDFAPQHIKDGGYLPLTIADMEFKTAPAITDAIKEAAEHGIFGYTYPDDEYFNALKGWMKERHDFDIEREWLLTTAGVVVALGAIVREFTTEGDGVIIQPPVYPPFMSQVSGNNREIIENPLIYSDGRYTVDFEDLEKKCKAPNAKLLILCNPHNPVGRVWSRDELKRMGEIAKENGVIVLSDEIHGELILPGYRHTTFATIEGMADNCIICTAMSKTFNLAGMCLSNILIPNAELKERLGRRLGREAAFGIPALSRYAAIAAFTKGGEWLDELIMYVNGNFEYLYDFVEKRLPMLKCIKAEGTYLAWIDMRALGLNNEQLEDLMLNKAFLQLDEGYIFGESGSGFERINLAMPRYELQAALERMEKAIHEKCC